MHVFTYGTLMFPEIWRAVVGREFESLEGSAHGYAIFRVRDAVFPGIAAAAEGSLVSGVVYLDVDLPSLQRLDAFEDAFYERRAIPVDCDDGRRLEAEAYVVPEANRHVLTEEPWDRECFVASGGLRQFIDRFAGFGRVAGMD
jgi:gamma-glutamylcyclotransferase (GGCT)/AIG2-like uncharacterized protein YtfP